MPKVIFGFRKGKRLDYRYINEHDRPESPFQFPDKVLDKDVKIVISWHGFLVFDIDVDATSAMAEFMRYIGDKACCGRCLSIKLATVLSDKLLSLKEDNSPENIQSALELALKIKHSSKCSLAPSSVGIIIAYLENFPDRIAYNSKNTPLKYYHHVSAPCIAACPANVKIPQFIESIRVRRFMKSLSCIRDNLPLVGLCGRICPHPCEIVCRRAEIDEPVNIMSLKQAAWNYEYYKQQPPVMPESRKKSGKLCAIIGAGPAGLTAAYYLAWAGHSVDIFEAMQEPGGMAAFGIPDFRQPRKFLAYDTNLIRNMGVNIHYNRKLGDDITIKYLNDTYDAVLLAVGAWQAQSSGIENSNNINGVLSSGIDFLRAVYLGEKPLEPNKKVIVIGGGNTALDCARTAVRFGCTATILYRRTQDEMPAEPSEIAEALDEGVEILFLTAPIRVAENNGTLKSVECVKMKLGELDATGRRSPEKIDNSNFFIDCDYLIPAIGQKPDLSFIGPNDGINITSRGTIEISNIYYNTSLEGFFAAGDCTPGLDTVVRAVGTGRWAAKMMDRYINTGTLYLEPNEVIERALYVNRIFEYGEAKDEANIAPRNNMQKIPLDERLKTFNEINLPLDEKTAIDEAKRCLHCLRLGMFGTSL